MPGICPVCESEAEVSEEFKNSDRIDVIKSDCPRCGLFVISNSVIKAIDNLIELGENIQKNKRFALSHYIAIQKRRSEFGHQRPLELYNDTYSAIIESLELPNPAEQADNLIIFIGESARFHTDQIKIEPLRLAALIGAYKEKSIILITSELQKQDLIECYRKNGEGNVAPDNDYKLSLTFKGWQRYEELKKVRKDSKKVFIAMGYGNADSERLYSEILPDVIKKELGLELIILRDNLRSGIVDNIMREDISQSCLLLAEMTNYNKGAYWEAGFAEGLKIPVIYLCEKSVFESTDKAIRPHFDVNHCTFIPWSFDTIVEDMKQLKATIRRTIPEKVKHVDL
jgi:hypothetical protein